LEQLGEEVKIEVAVLEELVQQDLSLLQFDLEKDLHRHPIQAAARFFILSQPGNSLLQAIEELAEIPAEELFSI
jgi:hypothetical protein